MESVVRIVVEPFFDNILKQLTELNYKINDIDSKIIKLEKEVSALKLFITDIP